MQRDITNVLTFSFKVPAILLKSYGNLNCVNRISKNTKYQILWKPVPWEPRCSVRTDRQTWRSQ